MEDHSAPPGKPSQVPSSAQLEAAIKQGLSLHQQGKLAEAKAIYEAVLTLQPRHFDALNLLGAIAAQGRDYRLAVDLLSKAIEVYPAFAPAHNNRGIALLNLGRLEDAFANFDKASSVDPAYAEAHNNAGDALARLGRHEEALAKFDKALALRPDDAAGWNNRGITLIDLKRPEEALASYDTALSLKPDIAQVHNNRGIALMRLKRPEDALVSYKRALTLKPDNAETWNNLGNALKELRRHEEAVTAYEKAVSLKPAYVEAHYNRGNALLELKRPSEALVAYDKAIGLKADHAKALGNRGYALQDLNRLDGARDSFAKALSLNPNQDFLLGAFLHTKMKLCEWETLTGDLPLLEEGISRSERVSAPFPILALLDRPDMHKIAAKVFAEAKFPANSALGPIGKRPADGKIRVGYYSADFHNHATAYLMAELLEEHDANRFELYGFSFGLDEHDDMRKRISSAFQQFFDVRDKTDREVAQLSREFGVDIAVDLKGYTGDSRAGVFVERCAPIQVNYLGYPATVGTGHIDYIIADRTVIPQEARTDFSEKVVYLPHSYQVNDSKRKISQRVFTKQDTGLPATGFVFCCFNSNYKILPATFDGWMRILNAVENSVLWLLEGNATAAGNLRRQAEARGVNRGRLVFAKPIILEQHLARHRLADLFLDTLPCNAHTTASDALWSGLPVLTCMGKSFASRVAASLLTALDLPELIEDTPEAYEAKAIALATHTDLLQGIRQKLARNRLTSPLFNGRLFARHLESAYEAMYARHLDGLRPDTIEVRAC